ncbi:MAG: phage major capsid protein [Bacteroidetes bacterium]|nr:phage major capsid protein [Bacteroidota bacterium]
MFDRQKELNEKRAKRAKLVEDQAGILDKSKAENRARTEQEKIRWDNINAEVHLLDEEIKQLEQKIQEDRNVATNAGNVNFSGSVDWSRALGDETEQYYDKEGKPIPVFSIYKRTREKNTVADFVGRNFNIGASEKMTPGRIISAFIRGARGEAEQRALSEGVSASGGYTVPIYTSAQLIDNVRAKATVFQAGAQTFILDSQQMTLAKITADATAAWVGEGSTITASDPTFGSVPFSAKAIKATVKASLEVIQDSINIGQAIDMTLTGAFAAEMDNAAYNGAGSATVPKGILNYSSPSIYAMGTNGAILSTTTTYNPFTEVVKVMLDNNCPEPGSYVIPPKIYKTLMQAQDSTYQPMMPPPNIARMKQYVTSKMPTNLTKGTSTTVCSAVVFADFSNLYFGSRLQTTIYPTTEVLATNGQYSFVAVMRGDWQPRREADFGVIKDIL